MNESFGDIVNWDLIPQSAISSIDLIPGSNPVFGLNTLGGALSIQLKRPFENPEKFADANAGSFGRRELQFGYGSHDEDFGYFVTGSVFAEDGWRDHTSSQVNQLYGDLERRDAGGSWNLEVIGAWSALNQGQSLPLSMLPTPNQTYTYPDTANNTLTFFDLRRKFLITDDFLIEANAYDRNLSSGSLASNTNNNFSAPISPGNAPGTNNQSNIMQTSYGASIQLNSQGALFEHKNNFAAGVSWDHGTTDFAQYQEDSAFAADRFSYGILPFFLSTHARSWSDSYGFYGFDGIEFIENGQITLAARYNVSESKNQDQTGNNSSLNGDNVFSRLNPSVGMTYQLGNKVSVFTSYSEGMRAPTPIELTCADPMSPCSLPNNFLSDPTLNAITSQAIEAGFRRIDRFGLGWNLSFFRTDLNNDIQFVNSGSGFNAGYFQNVGRTRRQGVEGGVDVHWDRITLSSHFGLISATFESAMTLRSPNNSAADAQGGIKVNPGNRLTGIPSQVFNFNVQYRVTDALKLGADLFAASSSYARGDENNSDSSGMVPGYAVLGLDAHYQLQKRWEIFGNVENVLNQRFQTFGQLGQNFFPGGSYNANGSNEQFRTPGAPRAIWAGVRYEE